MKVVWAEDVEIGQEFKITEENTWKRVTLWSRDYFEGRYGKEYVVAIAKDNVQTFEKDTLVMIEGI